MSQDVLSMNEKCQGADDFRQLQRSDLAPRVVATPKPTPMPTVMPLLDVSALLKPVQESAPCGPDLVHDAVFQALMVAARGRPEQQVGKHVIAAVEPNWAEVQGLATELMERSKDLRVAMQLLRAWTHRRGLSGFASGLQLIHGLLDGYWDSVHPLLDAEEQNDPTQRLNALAALSDGTVVPLEVRAVTLDGTRMGMTGREIELATGRQTPGKGETKPTPEGLQQALLDAQAREPGLLEVLQSGHAALGGIVAVLCERVGSAAPDLLPLHRFTQLLAETAAAAARAGARSSTKPGPLPGKPLGNDAHEGDGAIRSREDAMRELQRVREWIELNEPGHPAPLLIERARRLMAKSFMDIIKDILPEGVAQVQKLAGVNDK